MSILIQFAHPYPHRSRVNRVLMEAVNDLPGVRINDLYARYPDLHVDAAREQQLLREANLVIFQHPFYWYSGPALLKEWIDVVLEPGFAYGDGGTALHGKHWLQSVTTGMPEHTYTSAGVNRATMDELLRPFERTASFCGMHWLSPLVLHEANSAAEADITCHAALLKARIAAQTS